MRKYNHIFFDLDHTLWDFDVNAKNSLIDIYEEFELHQKIQGEFDLFYEKYLHHNKILWERYQNGFINAEELKWRRMWRTLLEFKIGDEALSKSLSARFLEILPTKNSLFPHTVEILNYLKEKKYTMHLITNGFEKTQWSKIQNSKIDHYFTHMITSEASNSMKPEKEIFEYALNKANATISESIMIGDNQSADIKGGINVGMDTVFVNHINEASTLNPTYVITHLNQLELIF
jgi:putative hydrolase of the HAD superfamily